MAGPRRFGSLKSFDDPCYKQKLITFMHARQVTTVISCTFEINLFVTKLDPLFLTRVQSEHYVKTDSCMILMNTLPYRYISNYAHAIGWNKKS